MGILNLFQLYKKKKVNLEDLRGKVVGVDIQCFLYRFVRGNSIIAFDIVIHNDYTR